MKFFDFNKKQRLVFPESYERDAQKDDKSKASAAANASSSDSSNATKSDFDDLGLSTSITLEGRFILPNGELNIERRGGSQWRELNIYQWLIDMPWWEFLLLVLISYVVSNTFFALLFMSCGMDALSGVEVGSWLENFANAFFFSVQTFTTVGYGSVSPRGWDANIIAALNALFGLMSFALATGLFFARFARPRASIRFSEKALIAPYKEINGFMFRVVNLRSNQLMDIEAILVLTWLEDAGDKRVRQFRRLELERQKIQMMPLNWTVVHPIDDKSPLYEKDLEDLKQMDAEFIIVLKGYDDTFAQNVHVHYSYKPTEMQYGVKFSRMYHVNKSGKTVLEIDKIDDVHDVPLNPPLNAKLKDQLSSHVANASVPNNEAVDEQAVE